MLPTLTHYNHYIPILTHHTSISIKVFLVMSIFVLLICRYNSALCERYTKAVMFNNDILMSTMTVHRKHRPISPDYLHSGFFGVEDSLVSTTGALAGIAVSAASKEIIIATALIIIAVESTSMAASEFISEQTEEDVEHEKSPASPLISGLIIFVGYILAGMVPLAPYLFLPHLQAIPVSIVAALIGLFFLGIYKGKVSHKSPIRSALEVLVIGGIAAGIGLAVGIVFKV